MKKLFLLISIVVAGYIGLTYFRNIPASHNRTVSTEPISNTNAYGTVTTQANPSPGTESNGNTDAELAKAFKDRASGLQIQGQGAVIKLLSDDNEGAKHQRFIIKLRSGQTLLVAHNIDIAPRISSLRIGDTVAFNGEYEWNQHGGVIHWTHHDPRGNHAAGWLKHASKVYR